jgi:hypothetical protein
MTRTGTGRPGTLTNRRMDTDMATGTGPDLATGTPVGFEVGSARCSLRTATTRRTQLTRR